MSLKRSSLKDQAKASDIRALFPARQLIANQQPEASRTRAPARARPPARPRATPPAPLPPPPPAPARASLSAPSHGEHSGKPDALRAGGRAENSTAPFQGGEPGAAALHRARRRFTAAEDAVILAGLKATPRVPYETMAQQLGRTVNVLRQYASEMGWTKGGALKLETAQKIKRAPVREAAEAVKPRRCLRCRAQFDPPGRFYFLCEPHRRGE